VPPSQKIRVAIPISFCRNGIDAAGLTNSLVPQRFTHTVTAAVTAHAVL
jgi:hypothetical protein